MVLSKRNVIVSFWIASITAVLIMAHLGPAAWDFDVYRQAADAVHRGIDPYAQGIAAQQAFHAIANHDPQTHAPMTYVYSPMTLPLLRIVGALPVYWTRTAFFIALVCGFTLQLWAGWQMATYRERRWLCYLLPAVAFFPGLLVDDVILSGNIAYLLYGLILAAAVPGWRRGRWYWYYFAVLVASCCKAPMLTMLAFPVLVGRRQWRSAVATGTAGCLLFLLQGIIWPDLSREYLTAVQLQFDFNRDFGFSPSGLLGEMLVRSGLPYTNATIVLYLVFASIVFSALYFTSSRIDRSSRAREDWLPVAILGTLLLNPRIKEYDVAAITVPLLLIVSRLLALLFQFEGCSLRNRLVAVARDHPNSCSPESAPRDRLILPLFAFGWFLAANGATSGDSWKPIELLILLAVFGAAIWNIGYRSELARRPLSTRDAIQTRLTANLPISMERREAS